MLNLNNAEKQLLERHPGLATALKFEEFAQLDNQIEATQYDTFNAQIEKGKLILEIEEKLKDQEIISMLEDMEMTWRPADIQRILRISNSWYYRLKKAAKFATGSGAAHTKTLYKSAIEKAKAAGQEVKIDIDSFNTVANAKAKAMKDAETTRYSDVSAEARENVLSSLVADSDDVTPEQIANDIRVTQRIFFEGSMKIKIEGQWKQIQFKKVAHEDVQVQGDNDADLLEKFQRACEMYLFANINTETNES